MEFLFLICLAIAIAYVVRLKQKKAGYQWKGLARQLGLICLDVSKPKLTGRFENRTVRITADGSAPQMVTRFDVEYLQMLGTYFTVTRQGYSLAGNGIETGYSDFDATLFLEGVDEQAVKLYFESRRARNCCLSIARKSKYMRVKITNRKISLSVDGGKLQASEIKAILRHLINTAMVLEERDAEVRSGHVARMPPPLPACKPKVEVPEEWSQVEEVAEVVADSSPVSEESPCVQVEIESDSPVQSVVPQRFDVVDSSRLTVEKIGDKLFEEKQGKYLSIRKFEESFKDGTVVWSAKLDSIVPVSTDRNFPRDSGWIVICDFGDFPGMESGEGSLKVKYRIGSERFKSLGNTNRDDILIEGVLRKFDPFTNTLYVDSEDPVPQAPKLSTTSNIISYSERLKKEMHSRPGEVRRFS